jgi:5'(3')-deoxyribonucleotidase
MRNPGETRGRKLRIAVDMDEVLANTLGKQLDLYNRHFRARVEPHELHGLELVDIVPEPQKQWVMKMLHEPGFFSDLEPIPSLGGQAKAAIRGHLKTGHSEKP